MNEANIDCEIEEVVADKGYHSEDSVDCLQNEAPQRTYIPEPKRTKPRTWEGKSLRVKHAYRRNRRNTRGARVRRLQRLRSERVERSFAHLCDTGGARRTWLRGLEKVLKRYMLAAMAHNLARILRHLLGAGKLRELAALAAALCLTQIVTPWCQALSDRLAKLMRGDWGLTSAIPRLAA